MSNNKPIKTHLDILLYKLTITIMILNYNCFTSSEHLMEMDSPSLSESVPTVCHNVA